MTINFFLSIFDKFNILAKFCFLFNRMKCERIHTKHDARYAWRVIFVYSWDTFQIRDWRLSKFDRIIPHIINQKPSKWNIDGIHFCCLSLKLYRNFRIVWLASILSHTRSHAPSFARKKKNQICTDWKKLFFLLATI